MNNRGILGIHYIEFYVANLFQAVRFYENTLGFKSIAYTDVNYSKEKKSILLKQNNIILMLSSPLTFDSEIAHHVHQHGDGVKDIAFLTKDARKSFTEALERGAKAVLEPTVIEDEQCKIIKATIATFGDTLHSFIEYCNESNRSESSSYLPLFKANTVTNLSQSTSLSIGFQSIDHVAVCVEMGELSRWKEFYENVLEFHVSHRENIHTEMSGMNSVVLQNTLENCKFTLVEPASGKKKSQITEFLDSYGGAGVQHIAFLSNDIAHTVRLLRNQGIPFLSIPKTYYSEVKNRLENIDEHLEMIEELEILIDHDTNGLLFQTFSKVIQTRPTFFFEVIERRGSKGFGSKNIKALFEAIEREQVSRAGM